MKAYQRFSKSYRLVNENNNIVGEYTTIEGAKRAAQKRNLKNFKIESLH